MKHIYSLIFVLLLFGFVFADGSVTVQDHLNEWKDIIVNSGTFFGPNDSVNVYVYNFDQTFDTVEKVQSGEYVGEVLEEVSDNTLLDEGTQLAAGAGAAYAGYQALPASRFLAKLASLNIPAGEFTTIKQAITVAESGSPMAPYMTDALTKYNMVYDNASGVLKFTDSVDDISIIPKQIKLSGGKTLSKVVTALRKAVGLDKYKAGIQSYKKLLEVRDGLRTLDTLSGAQKTAKAAELSAELSKLRNSGAIADDVFKAAGFVNNSGNVGQTFNTVALANGKVATNVGRLNNMAAATKPSVVSRISSSLGGKTSAVFKSTGKAFAWAGVYIGIPKAVISNFVQLGLGLTLPDVVPPVIDVESYSENNDLVGASLLIDPQFGLNVKRWKAARDSFEKSIDESAWQNAIWEAASFFDVTELGWTAAEYLPALQENQAKFIIPSQGCTVGIISNVSKEEMDSFIEQQDDFKCVVADSDAKEKSFLFLPKGKHVVMINSKMTTEMIDTVVSDKTSVIGVPQSIVKIGDSAKRTFAEHQYVSQNGFPSVPEKIIVENPIVLGMRGGDSLGLTINFKKAKSVLDYFKANSSLGASVSLEEIYKGVKFSRLTDAGEESITLKAVNISGNKLVLSVNEGFIQVGAKYRLMFDIEMNAGVKKLSLIIGGIKKKE